MGRIGFEGVGHEAFSPLWFASVLSTVGTSVLKGLAMKRIGLLLISWLLVLPAWALEVVATTPSLGVLVRAVGGDKVRVSVLASEDRDVHMLQARPSMMRALRDADLVVAVGAELEVGWLPAALAGANNPRVLPGRPGYFEAAAQVPLLEAGQAADRAKGDVHPAGNPHVHLDPRRMVTIAERLAERFGALDAPNRDGYLDRAQAFAQAVAQRLPAWQQRVAGSAGAVLYHKDAIYLLNALAVPFHGTIEPLPGVEPTARHLEVLASAMKNVPGRGVIIHTPYQPAAPAEQLAARTGWQVAVLPIEPPAAADADGYFALIERWVAVLESAR